MRKLPWVVIIFISLWISNDVQAEVATITFINENGAVYVKRAGTAVWQPAKLDFVLNENDSVKTADNTSVTILYKQGHAKQLNANQTYVVRTTPPEPASFLAEIATALSHWVFGGKKIPKLGIRRGADEPMVLYPRAGKLLTARPDFAWQSLGDGITYQIRLEKSSPNQCIDKVPDKTMWKLIRQDTLLHYPESEPELVAGQEYWIELKKQAGAYLDVTKCMTLVSEEERKRIEEQLNAVHELYASGDPEDLTETMVAAAFLMQKAFYTAAYKRLQAVHNQHPGNPIIDSLRVNLFSVTHQKDSSTQAAK